MAAEGNLDREHDAAHLAAGGDLGKGARREPLPRPVEELDVVRALAAPPRTVEPRDVDEQLGTAHLEPAHLLGHARGEARGGVLARPRQRVGGGGQLALGRIERRASAPLGLVRVVDERDERPRLLEAREHVLHPRAERAGEADQGPHALVGTRQRGGVEVDVVAVAAQAAGGVLDRVERLVQHVGDRLKSESKRPT